MGCLPGMRCEPEIDVTEFSGAWRCVVPGQLEDGESCNFESDGTACDSGFCVAASYMGLVQIGVCSECESDQDCRGGACAGPSIDLRTGLTPGVCVLR